MSGSTREQLLETAQRQFADRGFYGVSIANIADAHGLTKQALLHHFKSKEKLYGEVLRRIAENFSQRCAAAQASSNDPAVQLQALLISMLPQDTVSDQSIRLIVRELLDNQERADKAEAWYLRPLLEDLIAMAKRLPGWESASRAEALALVYQLLGAVQYYAISQPTLRGIFGEEETAALKACYADRLRTLIEAALSTLSANSD